MFPLDEWCECIDVRDKRVILCSCRIIVFAFSWQYARVLHRQTTPDRTYRRILCQNIQHATLRTGCISRGKGLVMEGLSVAFISNFEVSNPRGNKAPQYEFGVLRNIRFRLFSVQGSLTTKTGNSLWVCGDIRKLTEVLSQKPGNLRHQSPGIAKECQARPRS